MIRRILVKRVSALDDPSLFSLSTSAYPASDVQDFLTAFDAAHKTRATTSSLLRNMKSET